MWRQTSADDRAAGDRVRRSDKGISAVIDIEQRCLRAFKQNRASFGCGDVQEVSRVGDEWRRVVQLAPTSR